MPAERWVSIERYCEAIESGGGKALEVLRAPAPADPGTRALGGYVARYRRYPDLLAEVDCQGDVVHIADQALGHLVGIVAGPTLVTCHDLMPLVVPEVVGDGMSGWFDRTLFERSLEGMVRAETIIAVSEWTARDIERCCEVPRERIRVVPNIVNPAYRRDDDAEAWLEARGLHLGPRPRVLSVGHSRAVKNLEAAIDAMGEPGLRGVTLVRAGGPLTPLQLQRARAAGVADRIIELGHREPEAMARIYAACDVLVQPSHYEGFGMPVVEAMACGLPVVCSDGGSLPEVAGGAAVVVPLTNAGPVPAFARALEEVLSDEARAAMLREAGLARVQAFTPAKVIPQLVQAYQAAMEAHG